MSTASLFDFITRHRYAVVSTVAKDGSPEAALVGFAVTEDLKIIFDTSTNSRKYRNLTRNPAIAIVIGWDNEQTLQYEGIAEVLTANESDGLLQTYFTVFPDGKERKANNKDIMHFLVKPKWIRFSDYMVPKIEETVF
jgi:pyridoxine/pyridoxamine 5'-phosphate oxidase